MALPLAWACATGLGSVGLAFAYVLGFDFLRAMGCGDQGGETIGRGAVSSTVLQTASVTVTATRALPTMRSAGSR